MTNYYVIDTNITKEVIEQLATEGANFITLQSIKDEILRYREDALKKLIEALETNGRLEIKEDEQFKQEFLDDRLIQLCKQLLEEENSIELLTNDLLVHLKAQYNGINATAA